VARADLDEPLFTERELRQYDGSHGRPVYIAYEGVVYDVTTVPLWRTGMHQDLHYAGIDLTHSLRAPGNRPAQGADDGQAPHGAEVLFHTGVKRVGRLRSA
jgi:predicted heme/steroid binding protein